MLSKRYKPTEVDHRTWLHVPSGTPWSTSIETQQVFEICKETSTHLYHVSSCIFTALQIGTCMCTVIKLSLITNNSLRDPMGNAAPNSDCLPLYEIALFFYCSYGLSHECRCDWHEHIPVVGSSLLLAFVCAIEAVFLVVLVPSSVEVIVSRKSYYIFYIR